MKTSILLVLALAACSTSSRVSSAPPGSYLVVLDKGENTLSVIEPNSGHTRDRGPTGVGPHEAAASRDGRWIVVANYGDRTPGHTLTVYDLEERRVTDTIDLTPHERPHGIAFLNQRSRVLVTSETSGAVLEVDVQRGRVVRALDTGAELSHMLALAPDRAHVYTSNMRSGSVSMIELESGKLVRVVETGAEPEAIDVSPDGSEVWVGHNGNDTLVVLDARTLEKKAEIACGPRPIRLAFTPDGRHVLVSTLGSGEVAVIDARERKEVRRIAMTPLEGNAGQPAPGASSRNAASPDASPANPAPIGILVEPRGRFAYVANSAADRVAVIDLAQWTVTAEIETGDTPDGMAWAYRNDPTRLLHGGFDR